LFEPTGADQAVVDEVNHVIGPYDLNFSTASGQVNTGSGLLPATLGSAPATDMYAVAYDIDDNNQVDFGDLAFFAPAFGLAVGASEPPYTWWADFDKSGQVDFGDLAFFAPNFGKSRPSSNIVFPSNFPASDSQGSSQNASADLGTMEPSQADSLLTDKKPTESAAATRIPAVIPSITTVEPRRTAAVQYGPQQRNSSDKTVSLNLHTASVEAVFAEQGSQDRDQRSLQKRSLAPGRLGSPSELDEDLLDKLACGI
jgi:hypothetical protein